MKKHTREKANITKEKYPKSMSEKKKKKITRKRNKERKTTRQKMRSNSENH